MYRPQILTLLLLVKLRSSPPLDFEIGFSYRDTIANPCKMDPKNQTILTIPNLLSSLRLVIIPVLLFFGFSGREQLFLGFFLGALLTDVFDGYLARKLKQESELGARLDSWGDCALYIVVPACAWLLWPNVIRREAFFVSATVIAFALPVAIGFIKFGRLTSYHTWGAKLSAVMLGPAALLLFALDLSWPFHVATVVFMMAELEEIAITATISEWRANIPTFYHALRLVRDGKQKMT